MEKEMREHVYVLWGYEKDFHVAGQLSEMSIWLFHILN